MGLRVYCTGELLYNCTGVKSGYSVGVVTGKTSPEKPVSCTFHASNLWARLARRLICVLKNREIEELSSWGTECTSARGQRITHQLSVHPLQRKPPSPGNSRLRLLFINNNFELQTKWRMPGRLSCPRFQNGGSPVITRNSTSPRSSIPPFLGWTLTLPAAPSPELIYFEPVALWASACGRCKSGKKSAQSVKLRSSKSDWLNCKYKAKENQCKKEEDSYENIKLNK